MSPACRNVEGSTARHAHEDVIVQNAQKPVQERAGQPAIAYVKEWCGAQNSDEMRDFGALVQNSNSRHLFHCTALGKA